MRFNQQQLTRHLQTAQRLLPVYIVSGDETLLVQECTDAIRQACKQQGYSEREVMHVNTAFDWQTLDFCARSLSLFATKKLIELRLPGGKPGANGSKALINYMQKPVDDNYQ
jgi:DNA polymerase-3 subunit delta